VIVAVEGELIEDPILLARMSAADQAAAKAAKASGVPVASLPPGHPARRALGPRGAAKVDVVAENDDLRVSRVMVATGVALFIVQDGKGGLSCTTANLPA
jgi:hypothetical protein